eukprot:CAMPEP_0181182900 /NCGR_PEP_ID=MMETSP1096-20121128/8132_1 /TAXON_ID=156174 ORGANISM="Chrysochromulina ericina, Strain CCMP281" /NCGR_SAMPLE_ID=MMETSP1096 /ASSEMBLY_ACC=CAM_ASM_000453 /LENGTH=54 /DNA_ID=CAMNT_0023271531 /DNA_START=128 /DNA_END=292 /DNA_ORIENTATION=-
MDAISLSEISVAADASVVVSEGTAAGEAARAEVRACTWSELTGRRKEGNSRGVH